MARKTPEERFCEKWELDEATGCWLWTAARLSTGYGRFSLDGRLWMAHRVSYQAVYGPVPVGLELDHLCRKRACVNPDHLEAVNHRENVRRGEVNYWRMAKTHCPAGHAYDEKNTRLERRKRHCRACHVDGGRRHRAAKRALITPGPAGPQPQAEEAMSNGV